MNQITNPITKESNNKTNPELEVKLTTKQIVDLRTRLMNNVDILLESIVARRQTKRNKSEDIFGFDEQNKPALIPWKGNLNNYTAFDILQMEKSTLGVYLSGNPLDEYKPIEDYYRMITGETISLRIAILEKIKKVFTRSGGMMLALTLITHEDEYEGLVFPKNSALYTPILDEKDLYWIVGRIEDKTKKKPDKKEENDDKEASKEEETSEYQEKPKLIIQHLAKFEKGILELFRTDPRKNKSEEAISRYPDFDWNELKKNPIKFEEMQQAKITKSNNLVIEHLPRIEITRKMNRQLISDIKQALQNIPFKNSVPLEIYVENTLGELKRAKGSFWIDIDSFNEFAKK